MISVVLRVLVLGLVIFSSSPMASAQFVGITTLNQQVGQLSQQGRFAEAAKLAERVLSSTKQIFGTNHPSVGEALNNLATLYVELGLYSKAEPLLQRGLAIQEKASGPNHLSVATSLNNLANPHVKQARLAEAELYSQRSLTIREKVLGPYHLQVAEALDNLADIFHQQHRYAEAKQLLQRSLAIRKNTLRADHPLVGKSLHNLASLYTKYNRKLDVRSMLGALRLYRQALEITEKALGPNHPSVGIMLNDAASLYRWTGHFADAEKLYQRSLGIQLEAFGYDHPSVGLVLDNLAALHWEQGNWQKATNYLNRRTLQIARRTHRGSQIIGQALTGKKKSEAEQSGLVFKAFAKSAYRLRQSSNKISSRLASRVFQAAQWATGSGAASSLAKMAVRQATGKPQLARLVRERQDLVDEWQKRNATRTRAVAQPPSKRDAQQEAENINQLSRIDKRIAEIDQRLAAEFPDYASFASPLPLTVAEVQRGLQNSEALVLFLDTPARKPVPEETFIWLVTKTKSRWVRSELGGRSLAQAVKSLRCGLDSEAWKDSTCLDLLGRGYGGSSGASLPFDLTRAHNLYQSLFGQIEDLIDGKDLLIVPSGPLTQLPFQVLVTEKPKSDELSRAAFSKASWLIKKHAITVLPSVSSIKTLRAHAKDSTADKIIVGFGNPLLNGDGVPKLAQAARDISGCAKPGYIRTANLRSVQRSTIMPMGDSAKLASLDVLRIQTPLPETADELCAVARSAGADIRNLHLGEAATEARVKEMSANGTLAKYKMLHFATHGALAGELSSDAEPGLILTPPAEATRLDDGYLSASEVAGLKLDADWVILSACNTAGGEAKNAEALSGLAKAFFYAGARSLLVSHWYVDSHATVDLITTAFRVMRNSPELGRAKAMQLAMLSLLTKGRREWHPSFWAPFVVVGEGAG